MNLNLFLLVFVASAALAQEPATTEKGTPVYGKTTPHPVVAPEDIPAQPVIKKDAAPRKSNAAVEQNTKASTDAAKQTVK